MIRRYKAWEGGRDNKKAVTHERGTEDENDRGGSSSPSPARDVDFSAYADTMSLQIAADMCVRLCECVCLWLCVSVCKTHKGAVVMRVRATLTQEK